MIKIQKFQGVYKNKYGISYMRMCNFAGLRIHFGNSHILIEFPMPRLFINEFDVKHQIGKQVPTPYHKFFIKLKQLTSKFK